MRDLGEDSDPPSPSLDPLRQTSFSTISQQPSFTEPSLADVATTWRWHSALPVTLKQKHPWGQELHVPT